MHGNCCHFIIAGQETLLFMPSHHAEWESCILIDKRRDLSCRVCHKEASVTLSENVTTIVSVKTARKYCGTRRMATNSTAACKRAYERACAQGAATKFIIRVRRSTAGLLRSGSGSWMGMEKLGRIAGGRGGAGRGGAGWDGEICTMPALPT